ncbi:MAG: hypothetical protein KA004_10860 [Verrucomicrobiales bacterium]|nr:hypothetical protein [Verrucomicrobiales bacterium]
MPPDKKSKLDSIRPRMTPGRRFLLIVWIFIVFLITFFLFKRTGGRILIFLLIFLPLIFGLLLGLRMLRKFDDVLAALLGGDPGPRPPKSSAAPVGSKADFTAFMQFLRDKRTAGQFTRSELARWCGARGMQAEAVCQVGISKGWFREIGGTLVITSTGDQVIARHFGEAA